jgi:hypothetical protein
MSQKRDYFRVKFPVTQCPCLVAGSTVLEVIELSENGARVAVDGERMLSSDLFAATIRFKDGTAAKVTASVLRWETEYAILRFSDKLSYSVIAAEQRRLLQLFPRETAK